MNQIKVLFLAANPSGTTHLKLDEEIREITKKIRASELRDSLRLESVWAVQPDDLLQSLNQHRPHIVHFSGHGAPSGEIMLIDNRGLSKPISIPALKKLFTTMKDNIRVVVLNACYSRAQAKAITEIIDCAIGMKATIDDNAAITFASSFYRAIGFRRSIQEAFEQGKAALLLEGMFEEENKPELLIKDGVDPSLIYLTRISNQTSKQKRKTKPDDPYGMGIEMENAPKMVLPIMSSWLPVKPSKSSFGSKDTPPPQDYNLTNEKLLAELQRNYYTYVIHQHQTFIIGRVKNEKA